MKKRGRPANLAMSIGAGLIVAGVGLFFWLKFGLFGHPCDRDERVLSRDPQGQTVIDVFQACTAIGTATEEWVDLVSSTGGHVRIFTFVPWGGQLTSRSGPVKGPFQPSATWLTPRDLRLSIGTVAQVLQQQTEVAGVRITYDIRTDLSK